MKEIIMKTFSNALINERLMKINNKERQTIVLGLLKNKSEQELSDELGIPKSTLHDWKTLRQNNTGSNIHLSIATIVRKLENIQPEQIHDWGRIEQIKELAENLLRKRQ